MRLPQLSAKHRWDPEWSLNDMSNHKFFVAAFGAVLASSASEGKDLSVIAQSWQHYTAQCQQLYQNYNDYLSRLPERNPSGDPTRTVSPDGHAISIYLELDSGYVEAMVDVLSDRVVQHCSYYAELETSWDTTKIAPQYVQWLNQNSSFEIVGGYSPIYCYGHYRQTLQSI